MSQAKIGSMGSFGSCTKLRLSWPDTASFLLILFFQAFLRYLISCQQQLFKSDPRKQVGCYTSNKDLLSLFQFLLLQELTQKKIKAYRGKQKARNYLVLYVTLSGTINYLCSTIGRAADRSGSWLCCLWAFCWCMSALLLVKYYGPILLPSASVFYLWFTTKRKVIELAGKWHLKEDICVLLILDCAIILIWSFSLNSGQNWLDLKL